MALVLLVTGLVMNVVGVLLGSSRDLSRLVRDTIHRAASTVAHLRARFAAWWRRRVLNRKPETLSGSFEAKVHLNYSADGYAWHGVSDDAALEDTVKALVSRTDTLHDLVDKEREERRAGLKGLGARLDEVSAHFADTASQLEQRIDDFDVRPAGQRAFGAILVGLGTILMFAGGLIGR